MKLTPEDVVALVDGVMNMHGETWTHKDLLRQIMPALVEIESSRNQNAVRYEPNYRWTVQTPKKPALCSDETEQALQRFSWGLCQIMGATARGIGFQGWLTELLGPKTNLQWGLAYLNRLVEKFGDAPADLISAWNQGMPKRKEPGGQEYMNQGYVDRVLAMMTMTERGR